MYCAHISIHSNGIEQNTKKKTYSIEELFTSCIHQKKNCIYFLSNTIYLYECWMLDVMYQKRSVYTFYLPYGGKFCSIKQQQQQIKQKSVHFC